MASEDDSNCGSSSAVFMAWSSASTSSTSCLSTDISDEKENPLNTLKKKLELSDYTNSKKKGKRLGIYFWNWSQPKNKAEKCKSVQLSKKETKQKTCSMNSDKAELRVVKDDLHQSNTRHRYEAIKLLADCNKCGNTVNCAHICMICQITLCTGCKRGFSIGCVETVKDPLEHKMWIIDELKGSD